MGAPRTGKSLRSWGDLNLALNGLVRDGAIAGFRSSGKDNQTDPVIWITPPNGVDGSGAIAVVRSKLTGAFEDAEVRLDAFGAGE